MTAHAYFNWGRWVADCPTDSCSDARAVFPPDANGIPATTPHLDQACKGGHSFRIVMPPPADAAAIEAELLRRPHEADQSWFPKGHAFAVLAGLPHGQTLEQLHAETGEVEKFRTAQSQERQDQLVALLAEHGVEVRPDGTFTGSL
jgi:hypothetical protein